MSDFEPIPLILGPTAVGKSRVAYELALRLGNAEIISADARGIYEHLDIGTDKPPPEWCERVPHHLFSIKEPHETYSAMEFRDDAIKILEDCRRRDVLAIVAGGSTLYIDALLGKLFEGPAADPELRRELKRRPLEELYRNLKDVDSEAVARIHPHDRQRIVRALEVYQLTGAPISELQKQPQGAPYEFLRIGLTCERQKLYERINSRVEAMMQEGLLEEANALRDRVPPGSQAYKSNGYREMFDYLRGEIASLEEAVRLIKRRTRDHARRQLKYFRRDRAIHWIDTTDRTTAEVVEEILALLESSCS